MRMEIFSWKFDGYKNYVHKILCQINKTAVKGTRISYPNINYHCYYVRYNKVSKISVSNTWMDECKKIVTLQRAGIFCFTSFVHSRIITSIALQNNWVELRCVYAQYNLSCSRERQRARLFPRYIYGYVSAITRARQEYGLVCTYQRTLNNKLTQAAN